MVFAIHHRATYRYRTEALQVYLITSTQQIYDTEFQYQSTQPDPSYIASSK